MRAPLSIDPPSGPLGWYCLRVAARREQVAARNLELRAGVRVFSPRIRVRRNRDGAYASEPLFPGYVFARFRFPEDTRRIASTPGVLDVVSFGGPPRPVAEGVIERLDREVREADDASSSPVFEEGAWVRVITGCFRGTEGRVVAAEGGSSRVCVLLSLLGQQIQVSVPGDQLVEREMHFAGHLPPGLRSDPTRAALR